MKKTILCLLISFASIAYTQDSVVSGILLDPANLKINSYRTQIVVKYGEQTTSFVICDNYINVYNEVDLVATYAQNIVDDAVTKNAQILFNPFKFPKNACSKGKEYFAAAKAFQIIEPSTK